MRHYSHWVSPFGDLRVNAFFQLTEAFRRYRVLHRLLMPRHPPAALNNLTLKIVQAYELRFHTVVLAHDCVVAIFFRWILLHFEEFLKRRFYQ